MDLLKLMQRAEQEDPIAQFELAEFYSGQEIEPSLEEAEQLYLKAAVAGHEGALQHLIKSYRDGNILDESFLKVITDSAKKGDELSRLFYARMCFKRWDNGHFVKDLAVKYLCELAKVGNAKAQLFLSELYSKGEGIQKSKKKSRYFLNQAAQKDLEAARRLFFELKDKSPKRALHFSENLAQKNFLPAVYYLCFHRKTHFYFEKLPLHLIMQRKHPFNSEGALSRDEEEELAWMAFDYLRKEGEKGNSSAQVLLGGCYAMGKFIPISPELSFKWYARAAEAKNYDGVFALGCCYLSGTGIGKNEEKGLTLVREAAELGSIEAWIHLGFYYSETRTDESDKEAFKSFEKAAALGNPAAIYIVGRFYEEGRGIPESTAKAFEYFKLAAAKRLSSDIDQISVQQCIGEYYFQEGGLINYEKGLHYLQYAARTFKSWRATWDVGVGLLKISQDASMVEKAQDYFLLALRRMEEEAAWKRAPIEPSTFLDSEAETYIYEWIKYKWGKDIYIGDGFEDGEKLENSNQQLNMSFLVNGDKKLLGSKLERYYYYRYQVNSGVLEGHFNLGLFWMNNLKHCPMEDPFTLFEYAAVRGHAPSQFCMGYYSNDFKTKLSFLQMAQKNNFPRANYELGKLFLEEGDVSNGILHFKLAANGNDPDAFTELAKLEEDEIKRFDYYSSACDLKSPEASLAFIKKALNEGQFKSTFIFLGSWINRCYRKSDIDDLYEMATKKGCLPICHYLENIYYNKKEKIDLVNIKVLWVVKSNQN